MPPNTKPANLVRIFVDADVLFRAATASHEYTAALVLLRLSEFTLWDVATAVYTLEEAVRNIRRFLPTQEEPFLRLFSRSIRLINDPAPEQIGAFETQADWKDVINLAAAVLADAHVLATFNKRDYAPVEGTMRILTPGELLAEARAILYGKLSINDYPGRYE